MIRSMLPPVLDARCRKTKPRKGLLSAGGIEVEAGRASIKFIANASLSVSARDRTGSYSQVCSPCSDTYKAVLFVTAERGPGRIVREVQKYPPQFTAA